MEKPNPIIRFARGEEPVDLLLRNTRLVNVITQSVSSQHIAVSNGYIVGFGEYDAKTTVDLEGRFVAPGFIDAHVHIESAMTCIPEFVRAILRRGTTAVVADPHEIANVLGIDGIQYMLRTSRNLPVNVYFALPSCVPATDLESSGAKISAEDLEGLMQEERIVALAEMMNFPGVIYEDPAVLRKIDVAVRHRKPIDGHAPGLTGRDLFAYVGAGISSDHECTHMAEAVEKLEAGMHIMVREGTAAKNLESLLPVINDKTARRIMWCTDDRHPQDLIDEGHIDHIVRQAIQGGIDPVLAIQIATINPAEYFRIPDIGAIAPGKKADLIVFKDLESPVIDQVYAKGILTVDGGDIVSDFDHRTVAEPRHSMNVDLEMIDFTIPAEGETIKVIQMVPHQLVTKKSRAAAKIRNGLVVADPDQDILKIAVVERHSGSGRVGKAFVKGFGFKTGAIASSVAHDSHNIIIVGANDDDMSLALSTVVDMQGGLVVIKNGQIQSALPLPIAGIMSDQPVQKVRENMDAAIHAAHKLGTDLEDPFMILSFLALPVIPALKITDRGLIDVDRFETVSLFDG